MDGKNSLDLTEGDGLNSDYRMETTTMWVKRDALRMKSETQNQKHKRTKIVLKEPKPYTVYRSTVTLPPPIFENQNKN